MLSLKLLSEDPLHYTDAVIEGIRRLLNVEDGESIPLEKIGMVKMGTTVATNALLERKGVSTLLVINSGYKDALRIGYQNRPDLFALNIQLPSMLFDSVLEVSGRVDAVGTELKALDVDFVVEGLRVAYNKGIESVAIVLMHGYRFPEHEKRVAEIARKIGFK